MLCAPKHLFLRVQCRPSLHARTASTLPSDTIVTMATNDDSAHSCTLHLLVAKPGDGWWAQFETNAGQTSAGQNHRHDSLPSPEIIVRGHIKSCRFDNRRDALWIARNVHFDSRERGNYHHEYVLHPYRCTPKRSMQNCGQKARCRVGGTKRARGELNSNFRLLPSSWKRASPATLHRE